MKKNLYIVSAAAWLLLVSCGTGKQPNPNYIPIVSDAELYGWFRYSPDREIIVSGHRGGMLAGYPENCIESFEKTLGFMQSFFEIDPRLTKDSAIVLMHDRTIDRTTTGKGLVSDYTLAELKEFNLVDRQGDATPYTISTLGECVEWSRGKTILNLDIKDVPLDFMSDFVASLRPVPCNLMLTIHNPGHARAYLSRNPGAMFSAHCKNMDEFLAYEAAGFPWGQAMAYVGTAITPENAALCDTLHSRGVMCMISVAPTHDRLQADADKIRGYIMETATRPDVIETDYPYLFKSIDLSKRNF